MVNNACAGLFIYMLTCLRLANMTMPSCKMSLINMCNIKTDWGIVVHQNGTANIFILPLRHKGCRKRHLKQREVKL